MLENHSNMTADERKARIGSMHAWYCTFAPCELTEHSCFRPRWWVLNPKAAQAGALGMYFWLLWLHSCMRTVHASPRTADMRWNSGRDAVNVHFDVNECKLRPLREGHASRVQNRSWHCCSSLFCVKSTSAPLHSTLRKLWFKLALFFCFSEHLRCFFSPAQGNTCFWHSWLPWCVVGNCENGIGRVWLHPSAPAAAVAAPVIGKCINCLHWREEIDEDNLIPYSSAILLQI